MMNSGIEKRKVICWILFVVLVALLVFWVIFFGPENSKYFSIVYIAASIILLLFRIPFFLIKRAWVFFLLIIVNLFALLVHIFDTASVINIINLVVSYLSLYYLVTAGIRYLGADEFENITFKYLQYILLITLIVSPILTFLKWSYAPEYFPWQALYSDKRFLLIVGKGVGHSNAMWLMAFSGVFIIRNIFRQKSRLGNLVNILVLLLLAWGLIETKSRTALLFLIILLLGWAGYSKLLPKRLYALVPIIGVTLFYLSIFNPLFQHKLENAINTFQKTFPSIRIAASTTGTVSAYGGRDILNIALISVFAKNPWFGAGHSAPIFAFGIDQDGNIAYNENHIGGSESMLRMLAKYGSFYFAALFLFVLTPLIRAFNGYYRDNIFVISVCSIILVSGLNGPIFENLYDISSVFTIIILMYLVMPKYDKRRFLAVSK